MPGRALRKAWEAAFAADYARNAETLEEVRALAAQLEAQTAGSEQVEAQRLAMYCAACGDDIRAGVPHDSALGRLFRRS